MALATSLWRESLPRSRFHAVDEMIHQRRDLLATRGHARLGQQPDRTLFRRDSGWLIEKADFGGMPSQVSASPRREIGHVLCWAILGMIALLCG